MPKLTKQLIFVLIPIIELIQKKDFTNAQIQYAKIIKNIDLFEDKRFRNDILFFLLELNSFFIQDESVCLNTIEQGFVELCIKYLTIKEREKIFINKNKSIKYM